MKLQYSQEMQFLWQLAWRQRLVEGRKDLAQEGQENEPDRRENKTDCMRGEDLSQQKETEH